MTYTMPVLVKKSTGTYATVHRYHIIPTNWCQLPLRAAVVVVALNGAK